MKYYDLHTHTTHSDGHASVKELLQVANEKGYGLGVSDHLFCGGMNTPEDVQNYLMELEQYPILKGCEANIGEDYSHRDDIISRFDYVIASVHDVPDLMGKSIRLSEYFGKRAGEDCTWNNPFCLGHSERYLTALLPIIEQTMQTQRMDIYGHCTVLPFCEYLAGSKFLTDWENDLISLCKKYKVALEISGLWKEPGLDMVIRARAAGIKFTYGSDCHLIKDICDINYSMEIGKKAGLEEADFLIP